MSSRLRSLAELEQKLGDKGPAEVCEDAGNAERV